MKVSEVFPIAAPAQNYVASVDPIAQAIAACANPETPLDQVAEIDGKIRFMKERIGEYEKARDAAFIERIKAFGKPMRLGNCIFYLTEPETIKCESPAATLQMLLANLDLEGVERCLASGAFKHGATRKELEAIGQPELYELHFKITKKLTLKGEPITDKVLARVDENFIKRPRKGQEKP